MFDVFVPPTWRRYVAPPVITSTATASVPENTTAAKTLTASGEGTMSWSISGGIDAAKFSCSSGGALAFISPPDYEIPGDVGGDRIYNVAVKVTSSYGGTNTYALAITVTDVAEPPQFTSPATVNINENTTAVMTVTATGPPTITYSISGGADAAKFSIGSTSGVLAFISPPDYEAPTDSGGDNVYNVTIGASNPGGSNTRAMAVNVLNVADIRNPLVATYRGRNYTGVGGPTITHSGFNIGAAGEDRYVVAFICAQYFVPGINITSVQFSGVGNAVLIVKYSHAIGTVDGAASGAYAQWVPNGTTLDVTVNYDVGSGSSAVVVYTITGSQFTAWHQMMGTTAVQSGQIFNTTCNHDLNGKAIAFSMLSSGNADISGGVFSGGPGWTENFDAVQEYNSFRSSSAIRNGATAATNEAIQIDWTGGGSPQAGSLIVLSFAD